MDSISTKYIHNKFNSADAQFLYERQSLCYDWRKRLEAHLNACDSASAVQQLCAFQRDFGLMQTGIVDAQTRLKLIKTFPDLSIQLIGKHLEPRCIFSALLSDSAIYDKCEAIVKTQRGLVLNDENCAQILAIRGIKRTHKGIFQTESAQAILKEQYGHRTHFCSAKPEYIDSAFVVFWRENSAKKALIFDGTVNPCSIWPYGTSHLNNGQYFFKLGRHRTRERAHIEAVVETSSNWPENWVFDRSEDSIQYIALEGTSDIEVIRSTGESLDISEDDIRKAETAIAHRNSAFVDVQQIKINIHTCALGHASSLGCQNIVPNHYQPFISQLVALRDIQQDLYGFAREIPYTLIDASMIE